MTLHHIHLRKRRAQHLEPYPAKSFRLRWLDRAVLITRVLGPLATIPQIVDIFSTRSAGTVSVTTFGIYAAFDVVWIIYGVVHREGPITISYLLWFVVNVIVCIGAFIYAN